MERRWTKDQEREIIAAIAESAAEQIARYRNRGIETEQYRHGAQSAAWQLAHKVGVRLLTERNSNAIWDAIQDVLQRLEGTL